jgi:hypothetical protein
VRVFRYLLTAMMMVSLPASLSAVEPEKPVLHPFKQSDGKWGYVNDDC